MIILCKMKRVSKIVLINSEGKLLLQLRDNKPTIPFPGFWDFIGGEIENGETSLEAIKREIKEEINLEVSDIQFLGEYVFIPLNVHLTYFKGKIEKSVENIGLTEGQEVKYFRFNELYDLKIPEHVKKFFYGNKERIFN